MKGRRGISNLAFMVLIGSILGMVFSGFGFGLGPKSRSSVGV